jgi:hypothetical protein
MVAHRLRGVVEREDGAAGLVRVPRLRAGCLPVALSVAHAADVPPPALRGALEGAHRGQGRGLGPGAQAVGGGHAEAVERVGQQVADLHALRALTARAEVACAGGVWGVGPTGFTH